MSANEYSNIRNIWFTPSSRQSGNPGNLQIAWIPRLPRQSGDISKLPRQSGNIISKLPRQSGVVISELPRQSGDIISKLPRQSGNDFFRLPRQFGDIPLLPRQFGDSQIAWIPRLPGTDITTQTFGRYGCTHYQPQIYMWWHFRYKDAFLVLDWVLLYPMFTVDNHDVHRHTVLTNQSSF